MSTTKTYTILVDVPLSPTPSTYDKCGWRFDDASGLFTDPQGKQYRWAKAGFMDPAG